MARPSKGGHSKPATLATTMSTRIVSAPIRSRSKRQPSQSGASVAYCARVTQPLKRTLEGIRRVENQNLGATSPVEFVEDIRNGRETLVECDCAGCLRVGFKSPPA